jgi:hypothetical protein
MAAAARPAAFGPRHPLRPAPRDEAAGSPALLETGPGSGAATTAGRSLRIVDELRAVLPRDALGGDRDRVWTVDRGLETGSPCRSTTSMPVGGHRQPAPTPRAAPVTRCVPTLIGERA